MCDNRNSDLWWNEPAGGKSSVSVPDWAGQPSRPLVESADTARAIFVAVETRYAPNDDRVRYPLIEAIDNGKSWILFRWSHPRTNVSGDIVIEPGGGQLTMRIDKCDGRISHVNFTR